ncbi:MAG: DUF2795 domain-containing protein [Myxococcaceae bacterium]|nr:DUF2795 domain-containing protein [Myxococcaceae bacterium]
MAFGIAEDPALSVTPHLDAADYPISREDLVELAEDDGAPADVINLFKSLPRPSYESKEMVLRDLGEASRRMSVGPALRDDEKYDRRNIARDRVEGHPGGAGKHP